MAPNLALANLLPQKWAISSSSKRESLPAKKKIITPAGARLSTVLNADPPKSPLTLAKKAGAVIVTREVDVESFRQSQLRRNTAGTVEIATPTAVSIPETKSLFSEKSVFRDEEEGEEGKKSGSWAMVPFGGMTLARGKRRRMVWLGGVGVLVLAGLVIGLAVGLTRRSSSPSTTPTSSAADNSGATTPTPSSPPPFQTTTVPLPAGFPVGSWSVFTFLDTVLTNCTSNPTTWTCGPDTTYQQNAAESLSTFNFQVTPGTVSGSYLIAPATGGKSSVMSGIAFAPTPFELVDAGQPGEFYKFQIEMNKVDTVADMALTQHTAGSATCFYNSTTFQGSLYTKMVQSFPPSDMSLPLGANTAWPFAARVEQVVGGGAGVPACFAGDPGGRLGANVTQGLAAVEGGELCSCLYINYGS